MVAASRNFQQIEGGGKPIKPLLFNGVEVLYSASDKAMFFAKMVLEVSNLDV